jgi:hypothetical protein
LALSRNEYATTPRDPSIPASFSAAVFSVRSSYLMVPHPLKQSERVQNNADLGKFPM